MAAAADSSSTQLAHNHSGPFGLFSLGRRLFLKIRPQEHEGAADDTEVQAEVVDHTDNLEDVIGEEPPVLTEYVPYNKGVVVHFHDQSHPDANNVENLVSNPDG